jgi:hypothetical protein
MMAIAALLKPKALLVAENLCLRQQLCYPLVVTTLALRWA